jgi:hypothetical protein
VRSERRAAGLAVAALATTLLLAAPRAWAADTPATQGPTRVQVEAALAEVRQDPNLPGKKKDQELRLKPQDKKPDPEPGDWPEWLTALGKLIEGFSRGLGEAGRIVMWVLGFAAIALLLVGLRHWVRVRGERQRLRPGVAPSHVGALDIRPETLPERIGEAARAMWLRGEPRAALSLLYRGALSRLVHRHAVPIRAASTEGDCLRLARRAPALPEDAAGFFAQLVAVWQQAGYGDRLPDAGRVLALCDAFEAQLGRTGRVAPAATAEARA